MTKVKIALAIILFITVTAFITLFVQTKSDKTIFLTEKESQYLKTVSPITIAVDPDWEPFEKLNEKGEYSGIAADYVKLLEERLNIKFRIIPTKDWSQSLQYSKEGKTTCLSFLNETPEREKWLIFTEPLIVDDNVIIGRYDSTYISDLALETNKTVVLPEGTSVEERVRQDYPNLTIKLTKTEKEALELVSEGKADFTIRSMLVGAYNIRKQGWFDLKVIGEVDEYTNYLRIGVLKDQVILRSILNKAILSITEQERVDILNRHVPLRVEKDDKSEIILNVLIFAIVVASLLLILSSIQSYRAKRLARRNKEIEEITARYEALSELAGTYFWQLDMEGIYTYINPEVTKVLGFEVDELLGKNYQTYIHAAYIDACQKSMAAGEILKDYEILHYKKDASSLWVKVNAMPLFDKDGCVMAYRGSSTNVEKRKQLEDELIRAKNEIELAYYQAQIRPHFLYNSLNAIAMYCITEPKKASSLIVDLSFFLRKSFDFKSIEHFVTLEQELELIDAYVNIEKVRFQHRLQVYREIQGVSPKQLLPPLILQPLVENAITHGLMKRLEGGTIWIRAIENGDTILFEVQDDGVGIDNQQIQALESLRERLLQGNVTEEASFNRQGIGLKNIHLRLIKMYNSELNISHNETGGTTAYFTLPKTMNGGMPDDEGDCCG